MEKKRNVMCSMCQFETNKMCDKKHIGVTLNKKRSCAEYEEDENKISAIVAKRLTSTKPEATFRPDWYWDKKLRKQLQKEAKKQEILDRIEKQQSIFTGDPAHPITGDLSKFVKSTVGE